MMKGLHDEKQMTAWLQQDEAIFAKIIEEMLYIQKHGQLGRIDELVRALRQVIADRNK